MGGYGFTIGRCEKGKVMLWASCSTYPTRYRITIETSEGMDIASGSLNACGTDDINKLEEFMHSLNESYDMNWIKDEGLRDKAHFEMQYRQLEKDNIKLKEQVMALQERIKNAKRILD
jgi:hypothetical protein